MSANLYYLLIAGSLLVLVPACGVGTPTTQVPGNTVTISRQATSRPASEGTVTPSTIPSITALSTPTSTVTPTPEPSVHRDEEQWKQIEGEYVRFQVPRSWHPTEREPSGGKILEEWHLGIPQVESDQTIAFYEIPFDQARSTDSASETTIMLGGKPGVKRIRGGEGYNYTSYDYYTTGHNNEGSFGIHVTVAESDDVLERQLDRIAESVEFKE